MLSPLLFSTKLTDSLRRNLMCAPDGRAASRLAPLVQTYSKELVLIMRVYFEKPRTTVGWKGLINDPDLDGSYKINKGLRTAREVGGVLVGRTPAQCRAP